MASSTSQQKHRIFRELLSQCRKDAGITQRALAALLHKPQSYVSKYESGERRLDVIEFLEVAAALNIDPKNLLDKINGQEKNDYS